MKFLVAQFMHETNTFCGIRPGREEFAAREYYEGEDIPTHLRGTRTMVGAFIDFAEANDVELIWTIDAFATPAGIVQRTFYEEMVARILDAVTDDVDGVLLSLHGAMVVEDIDDGEGEFLARLRQRVGRDCPIATVLDFHTNLSPAMVANADVLVGYKHYPHIDMYEAGMSAATLLHRCVRGEIHPVRHAKYIPILAPLGHTSTFDEPMKSIVLREEEMEAMAGVLSVSVFGGFPYADIPDAGMSALVITAGDRADGDALAQEFYDRLYSMRQVFLHEAAPIGEAVKRAMAADKGPVILADVADNPGGGGANDGVEIVRELIARDAPSAAVSHIADADAAEACHAAGLGAEVNLTLGAKTDEHHGKPVTLNGVVTFLSDGRFTYEGPFEAGVRRCRGKTAVVKSGDVEVVIAERRLQNLDLAFFRSAGIEPTERRILVVKSSIHYRAAYEPIAAAIIEVDAPGLVTPNLRRFEFSKVRRPIFPLDDV